MGLMDVRSTLFLPGIIGWIVAAIGFVWWVVNVMSTLDWLRHIARRAPWSGIRKTTRACVGWPYAPFLTMILGFALVIVAGRDSTKTDTINLVKTPGPRVLLTETLPEITKRFSLGDLTQEQTDRLMAPYKGKWVRQAMQVTDVHSSVVVESGPGAELNQYFAVGVADGATIIMSFDYASKDRLALVNKWNIIEADCQISRFMFGVYLDHCELLDVRAGPTPTATMMPTATPKRK